MFSFEKVDGRNLFFFLEIDGLGVFLQSQLD